MIRLPSSACTRYRGALVDFVDRREAGPTTGDALEHLDRCRACEAELTEIALAIVALRRLHVEARDVEPARDAWVRISANITRRPASLWRWRMTLGGLVTSATLVGVLAGPLAMEGARHAAPIRETLIETVAPGMSAVSPDEVRIETAFIVAARRAPSRLVAGTPAGGQPRVDPPHTVIRRIYADGIRVVGEEVAITESSERPPGVS